MTTVKLEDAARLVLNARAAMSGADRRNLPRRLHVALQRLAEAVEPSPRGTLPRHTVSDEDRWEISEGAY